MPQLASQSALKQALSVSRMVGVCTFFLQEKTRFMEFAGEENCWIVQKPADETKHSMKTSKSFLSLGCKLEDTASPEQPAIFRVIPFRLIFLTYRLINIRRKLSLELAACSREAVLIRK